MCYFVRSTALWYKQNPVECKRHSMSTPSILLHPQFIVSAGSRVCFHFAGAAPCYSLLCKSQQPCMKLKMQRAQLLVWTETVNIHSCSYFLNHVYALESLYKFIFVFCRRDILCGRRPRQRTTRFGIIEESPLPSPSEKLPVHGEETHNEHLSAPPSLFPGMHKHWIRSVPSNLPDLFLGFCYILKAPFSRKWCVAKAAVLPQHVCYSSFGDFRFQTAGSDTFSCFWYGSWPSAFNG